MNPVGTEVYDASIRQGRRAVGSACGHPSRGHEDPRRGVSVSSRRGWGPGASETTSGAPAAQRGGGTTSTGNPGVLQDAFRGGSEKQGARAGHSLRAHHDDVGAHPLRGRARFARRAVPSASSMRTAPGNGSGSDGARQEGPQLLVGLARHGLLVVVGLGGGGEERVVHVHDDQARAARSRQPARRARARCGSDPKNPPGTTLK